MTTLLAILLVAALLVMENFEATCAGLRYIRAAYLASAFGIWRHKKGGLYLGLCRVQHSERQTMIEGTDLKPESLVLYVGCKGPWVRPAWMFFDGRFTRVL